MLLGCGKMGCMQNFGGIGVILRKRPLGNRERYARMKARSILGK